MKALSKYSHPAILRRINAALAQDVSPAVRVAAVDMLTKMAGKEASTALEKALLEDVIEDVQLEAALALRSLGVSEGSRAAMAQRLARPNVTPALRTVLDEMLGASHTTRATG